MPDRLSLPTRIYLLAYDQDRDRLAHRTWLGHALRAGALADLLAGGYLTDAGGRAATVAGPPPPADPVLRHVLADTGNRRWRTLVGRDHRGTENAVVAHLDAAGLIRIESPATLWRRPRIELRDPRGRSRLAEQVSATLRGPLPIDRTDAADVTLIAILAVAGLTTAITRAQRKEYADRIAAAVTAAGAPVAGLKQAIRQASAG
jgi:Golgi phosphoprotein 3 (GPP34)